MYSEFVGESPLSLISEDIESITKLLAEQVKMLNDERESIKFEDPKKWMIYDMFYAKTPQAIQLKITKHIKELKSVIINDNRVTKEIRSIKTLKPYLIARNEANHMHGFGINIEELMTAFDEEMPF